MLGAGADKYKLGARAGKYKLGARASKYKLGAKAGKYKLGARAGGRCLGPGPGPGLGAKQRAGCREIQRPIFHNFRIIFHDQKTLSLNSTITSVCLRHYVSTKIFVKLSIFLFLLICFGDRSSHQRCSVLINFANFTGKHLRWSLFLIKF